jgi:hypothetical protein
MESKRKTAYCSSGPRTNRPVDGECIKKIDGKNTKRINLGGTIVWENIK